jgi:hypothetical protein
LLSSTTVPGQTAAMISSFATTSPARSVSTPRMSSARADRDRLKLAAIIAPRQPAAAPIEAEFLEEKNVRRSDPLHARSPAVSSERRPKRGRAGRSMLCTGSIFGHFGKFRKILSPIRCFALAADHPDRRLNDRRWRIDMKRNLAEVLLRKRTSREDSMKKMRAIGCAAVALGTFFGGLLSVTAAQPSPAGAVACNFIARGYVNATQGTAVGYFTGITGISGSLSMAVPVKRRRFSRFAMMCSR